MHGEGHFVRDRSFADALHGEFAAHLVLKSRGMHEVARRVHAGPSNGCSVVCYGNAHSNAAQERVFGLFHPPKKVREVCDSSHVGFAELHSMCDRKRAGHGCSLRVNDIVYGMAHALGVIGRVGFARPVGRSEARLSCDDV